MKKLYNIGLLACTLLLMVGTGYGQASETFESIPANNSSYTSRVWTGDDGVEWTAEGARTDQTLTMRCLTFGNSGNRWVTSPVYSGGMGNLTFNYVRGFTGTGARSIEVWVNGVQIGESITVSNTSNDVVQFNQDINVEGDVQLEIRSTGAAQVKVDDVVWTAYSATPDETAPSFITGFPAVTEITGNGAKLEAQLDEAGTIYYVLVEDADGAGGTTPTTPTAEQVKAGQNAAGDAATLSGSFEVADADITVSQVLTGLSGSTSYYAFIAAEDAIPNLQMDATIMNFMTGTADNTAPQHVPFETEDPSPSVRNIQAKQFDVAVQLDEPGTIYWVLLTDQDAPSAEQTKAGQDGTGAAAPRFDSFVVSEALTETTITIDGLTPSTEYDLHMVAEDDETTPNLGTVFTRVRFTAADTDAPVLQTAATGTGAAQTITLTFDEDVQATDATGFSVSINAAAATVSGLSVDGSTITLTIAEEIFVNDVVVLNYAAGNVQDLNGNGLATITDQAVTNNATTVLVADLSDLRSQDTGSTVYRVAGEVFFTYGFSNRNQKYFQDANAGILIDDTGAAITTAYSFGDGVTGLEGRLGTNAGVLQFIPTRDGGAPTSSENIIEPMVVTAAAFKADINAYESRVIMMEALTFATAGDQFSTFSDSYTMTDASAETIVFRDQYSEADYSSFEIPYGRHDVIGLASEFNGTAQIFPYSQTESVLDVYAPLFTVAPAAENVTFFSADITFTADEPGYVYYTVVANDAAAPLASTIIGEGEQIAMTVGANTINLTELTDNTMYDVYIVATDDEGTPNAQETAVKVDVDTPELIFNADSDVTISSNPILAKELLSTNEGDMVLRFTVTDAGSGDSSPTYITSGTFVPGEANTADWSTTIEAVALEIPVEEGEPLFILGEVTEENTFFFDLAEGPLVLPDGGFAEVTLLILLSSTVTDGDIFQVELPATGGITADGTQGSSFPATLPGGAVASPAHTIQVVASTFAFDVAQSVALNEPFSLTISAVDANGNVDNAARNITLVQDSGTGTLTTGGSLEAQPMVNGVFTWDDLQLDVADEYSFRANDGTIFSDLVFLTAFEKTGDLFISEYIDGASSEKAIEIYNNLGGTADLSQYIVGLYSNGSPTYGNFIVLSDIQPTLENGGVLVIANAGATGNIAAAADGTSNITFFNGDDAVALLKNDVVIDVIGEIGVDPGTGWAVAGVANATADVTLVRKNTVTEGNPVGLASFGTNADNSEWIIYPYQDYNYIGFHIFGEQPFPLITLDQTGFNGNFGYLEFGTTGTPSSYVVSAEDLSEDLIITPPAGFLLSDNANFTGGTYDNELPWTITPVDGVVNQTVYVQFTPLAVDGATYSGDITHVSAGAETRTVAVSGIEGVPAVNSLSGVVINEILYDPNGTYNYDTDGSGTAATEDEFVEIFNTSESPVDISGWQLWDESASAFFTFPAETVLGAGKYAAVMGPVQTGGTLPAGVDGNLTYSVASGMSLSNSGENVALLDPNSNTYVQVKYGATEADAAISGLASATIVGIIEAWGTSASGSSLVRSPEGSATIVNHADIQGAESASFAAPAIDPNAPFINITSDRFHFGNLLIGQTSETQVYMVSGNNLVGDITVTAPAAFEVSSNGTDFSSSLVLTATDNAVAPTSVYVRFSPTAFGSADGVVTHTSTDAPTIEMDVTGAGIDENTIYFNGFGGCANLDDFNAQSIVGNQTWACTDNGETGSGIAMSGFNTGTFSGAPNEDWIVSPAIDLSTYAGADLSFDSDVAFDGTGTLTVFVSTDYSGDVNTATWTELNAVVDIYSAETENDRVFVSSGDIALPVGGTVNVAFRYISEEDANGAVEYRIDNFLVYETQPVLEVNSAGFNNDFNQQEIGTFSVATSFTVNGFGLTENVSVTPPAGYEVSLANTFATVGTNGSPLSITATDGIVDNVTVYVRFAPTAVQTYSGNIVVASAGFDNVNLAVTGAGIQTTTGIADELGIKVYPNPSRGVFTITNDSGQAIAVELYSLEGARMTMQVKDGQYDISALNAGLYILMIKDAKGNHLGSERILKK